MDLKTPLEIDTMKMNEKMEIRSHTFINGDEERGYKYEITFNRSLEHTCGMDAMCDGLNRYDKRRKFWMLIHHTMAVPLWTIFGWNWTKRFYHYTNSKF